MTLNIDAVRLEMYLKNNSDCEEIATGEFVADVYDTETPVTLNLTIAKGKVICEAAAYLMYDEEQDGWYMGERIQESETIEKILEGAMAQ